MYFRVRHESDAFDGRGVFLTFSFLTRVSLSETGKKHSYNTFRARLVQAARRDARHSTLRHFYLLAYLHDAHDIYDGL